VAQKRGEAGTQFTGDRMIGQARQSEAAELARYREDLLVVHGSCLICRAGGDPWDHAFSTCHRRHGMISQRTQARRRYESKGQQWLRPYTACFWCFNPQAVCRRADLQARVEVETCGEKDAVLPLCYGIFESEQGGEWLHDRFGRHFQSIADYFDWLGEECLFGGGRAIQAVRVAAAGLADFHMS